MIGLHSKSRCRRCSQGSFCAEDQREREWERWHEEDAPEGVYPTRREGHGMTVAQLIGWDSRGRLYDAADPIEEERS